MVEPSRYSIVVEGELGSRYEAAFNRMRLETGDGTTAIVGLIEDQAEPQGLLDTVAALGLSLVSVAPLDSNAGPISE